MGRLSKGTEKLNKNLSEYNKNFTKNSSFFIQFYSISFQNSFGDAQLNYNFIQTLLFFFLSVRITNSLYSFFFHHRLLPVLRFFYFMEFQFSSCLFLLETTKIHNFLDKQ